MERLSTMARNKMTAAPYPVESALKILGAKIGRAHV